jgi:hypothetical protein
MDDDEVGDFSGQVSIEGLRDYWRAVGRRSQEVIEGLRAEDLDEVPQPAHLRAVLFDEGVIADNAGWIAEYYTGRPRGWFLGHLAMRHHYLHAGDAATVVALYGIGGKR